MPVNIRKPADYSNLFSELDKLMTAQFPQMDCTVRSVGWSAAEWRKVRLLWPLNICETLILRPMASLPATCAVCESFTQPTRNLLKSYGWQ